jgi:hypothetical protein
MKTSKEVKGLFLWKMGRYVEEGFTNFDEEDI